MHEITHVYASTHTHHAIPTQTLFTFKAHKIYVQDKQKKPTLSILMFCPCSLLVVGWLQPLLSLNMGIFYSKDNQNTVYHSNTHCKWWKWIGSFTLKKSDDPQSKSLCQGYNIADCHIFGSRHHYAMAITAVVSIKRHLLAYVLGAKWAQHKPSRSKDSKTPSRRTPHCFKPSVRFQVCGGSSTIPVDYNNNGDASIGNSEHNQTGFKQSDQ